MKNRKPINAKIDLESAMHILESHGIRLPFEAESEVKGRISYLAGLLENVRLSGTMKSEKIARIYLDRNNLRRSVIIFHVCEEGYPGSSTVIMPIAGASFDEVERLITAVRKIVSYTDIYISDLYDKPVPSMDDAPF